MNLMRVSLGIDSFTPAFNVKKAPSKGSQISFLAKCSAIPDETEINEAKPISYYYTKILDDMKTVITLNRRDRNLSDKYKEMISIIEGAEPSSETVEDIMTNGFKDSEYVAIVNYVKGDEVHLQCQIYDQNTLSHYVYNTRTNILSECPELHVPEPGGWVEKYKRPNEKMMPSVDLTNATGDGLKIKLLFIILKGALTLKQEAASKKPVSSKI
jgi:hypothetical protein